MSRVLAIDYGTKRTGIAVTDPLRIIASGLETVATDELTSWLRKYCEAEAVDIIVVGKPTRMDGTPSETMPHVEGLVKRLKGEFSDKDVVLYDERFTSKLAQRAIIDGGVKKMARRDKSLVDKVSAAIILQSYLESKEYKR